MPTISVKFVLWVILCGLCIWAGGYLYFATNLEIDQKSGFQNADGIVILTGTTKRLEDGFRLLKKGKAKRLLVSGVNLKVTKEELRILTGQTKALMDCCVDLGRTARDTVGNARETARWVQRNNFQSLIVVTSAYHLPRGMTELVSYMPDIQIRGYATQDEMIKLENWWSNFRTAMLLVREYNKYIYSLLRARLQRGMSGEISS